MVRRCAACGLLASSVSTAFLIPASPAFGQAPAAPDSILVRLERAEEQIALLRQQLATQAQSQVQAKSRVQLEFWGRMLANAWRNDGGVNSLDVPTIALPAGALVPQPTIGAAFRQTTLGIDVTGVQLGGAGLSASLSGDFFGGVQTGAGNRRLFPEPRLRIVRLAVKWPAAEIMVGQDVPVFAPVEPVSLASVGTPNFASAGNLWFWLPQVRISLATTTSLSIGVQGAVLAPWSNEDPATTGNIDAAERSGRPSLQGRVRARWHEAEIGVGGHVAWIRRNDASLARGAALSATAEVPVGWFDLRGEIYQGRLLRGLGGGGVSQNFGTGATPLQGVALDDRGGWGQLNLRLGSRLMVGGGCGVDDPRDGGLPARSRNQSCEGHLQLRPAGPIVLAFEGRRIETKYLALSAPAKNTHLNLAIGVEF